MKDKVFDIPKDTEEVAPIKEAVKEAPKKPKTTKAKKVIDDSTRESLVEKLKQSRKIKGYEKENAELKNKITELENAKEDKVIEDKPKKVSIPKIKVIDEPSSSHPSVARQLTPNEPKEHAAVGVSGLGSEETPINKYIYSTFTRPLWK
jgi:hypothetical protein